jgi:hypothetical protein
MNVHLWDFAGHVITHSAHRCFMSSRCLYIYVYDGRIEHNNRPEYWLEQIRIYGGNSPILFLINKRDDHVPEIERKTLQADYPNILGYHTVDIGNEDLTGLIDFRQLVINTVRGNPSWNSQEVPSGTYRIKQALIKKFKNLKTDYITRGEFNQLASRQNISQEETALALDDLHALGICLCYNDVNIGSSGTLVLNPAWITKGIYKIINWGNDKNKHILSISDGKSIFSGEELMRSYPTDKVKFIFNLMQSYELAFITEDKKLFAPLLLPVDRPDKLPEPSIRERLRMVFSVEKALPPNIVSRLIVQRNKDIEDEAELWRKGAVLHFGEGDAIARIIEDARSIEVIVTGPSKTDYIKSIRETLINIFESYKGLYPKLEYEVLMPDGFDNEKLKPIGSYRDQPLMLENELIARHILADRSYFDGQQDISLLPTGSAYSINNVYYTINVDKSTNYNQVDNSIHTTFNIQGSILHFQDLQGEMSNLASTFKKKGFNEDADEIIEISEALDDAEDICKDAKNEKEMETALRKKGILSRLKKIGNELIDENSNINPYQAVAKKLHPKKTLHPQNVKVLSLGQK